VDVYSLHMDAGRDGDDAKTRDKQAAQLAEYLGKRGDRAAIIAGDTNMKQSDEPSLLRLLDMTKLRDACRELQCAEPHLHDRVFVKDSAKLHLSVANWRRDKTFVSADGKALSDHDPVAVDVSWTKR
jgi:endonuclease/exonuclease/phosphatase family metal-dependent hydrolase